MAQRAGGDKRGSAADRRNRKNWLLSDSAPFGGNGVTVPCVFCKTDLTFATLEADRVIPGGSYRRGNVQPACRPCNLAKSDDDISAAEILLRVQQTFSRTGRMVPALAV